MKTKYLVPLSEEGDGPPMFIVPSAGATFFSFVTLARTLTPPGPIYSFSLTEIEVSATKHSTLEAISDVLLEELRAVHPHGPYYLGGHCWGGVAALHMASCLEALGEEVKGVFLMESFVPVGAGGKGLGEESSGAGFKSTMDAILEQTLRDARAKLARMPKKHADRLMELTANQIQTGIVYDPATIGAPVRLFRTDTHDDVAFHGWEDLCSGDFSVQFVPGDTHSMIEKPHIETLCGDLEAFIRSCA